LQLLLTDVLGRSWSKTVDFMAPAAPGSLWFSSDPSRIEVHWTVADTASSPDVAGYRVYRSATSGSGHVKRNFELLREGARYVDSGLSLGSNFYYYVTSVDSSGNEGPPSPELPAWTTQ
jgi:hypothetical protein